MHLDSPRSSDNHLDTQTGALPHQASQHQASQHQAPQHQALRRSGLLDSPSERAFDRLTALACRLLNTPIALITLVDTEAIFVKSSHGLPASWATQHQLPFTHSLCQQVVNASAPVVIHDLMDTQKGKENSECGAQSGLNVAAYLGIPLLTPTGECFGAFCVIDRQPRIWSEEAVRLLQELAAVVIDEIALRIHLQEGKEGAFALQTGEEQLRLALEGAQLGAWSIDLYSKQVYYDRRARTILGLSDAADYADDGLFSNIHPADHAAVRSERDRALETHAPYVVEFRVQHMDGELRWIQAKGRAFYAADGAPWRLAGVLMDVTEQRQTEARLAVEHEEKLRKREKQLQAALMSAQIGTWEVNLHTYQVTRSASLDQLFGFTPTEAPRKIDTYWARVHPADIDQLREVLEQAIKADSSFRVECRILLPDGFVRWITLRGEVVRDEGGRAQKLQGALVDITQRKGVEVALQRGEQHLRNVIDSLFAFVGVMTPDGILIEANRTALAAANLQPEDVLGKPFEEAYWWSYSIEVQTHLRATIKRTAAGETLRYDVTIRLAENQYVIIDFMLSPIRNAEGVVTYLVPSAIDVTGRKLIEQALRVSEERFRNTFEQAAVGIAHVALDGAWLRVNQRLCDIIGYHQDKLLQTTFQHLTHPDDLAADLEHVQRLLAGEIPGYQMEKRYFRQDGSFVWTNLTASLVRTVEGNPDYFIAVVEDISDRKAAEEALRTSEARFRAVQQATPDGFMIFDSIRNHENVIEDFRWVYTNPAGERLTGRTHEELVGRRLLVEMPGNRAEGLFDAYVQVVESGKVWQREFAYTHEGFAHWFRSTAAKAGDGFAVAFTDITAHKEATEALRRREAELRQFNETLEVRVEERTKELEERNRELDQFAYVASHDLRAPLRAIEHLSNWILEDAAQLLPLSSQEHFQKLRGRVARMEKLLDDLLIYSRAGRLRSVLEVVDTGALVRSILEMIAPAEFDVIIAEPMPTVCVERVPLETALRNLIGNAIKHHDRPQEGRIEVTARELPTALEFVVSDNGPGIDPQFHERIFGIFQTLKPRDQVEASGMGLAIVKKIIESRGGTITVESREGAGATFRFSWPKSAV